MVVDEAFTVWSGAPTSLLSIVPPLPERLSVTVELHAVFFRLLCSTFDVRSFFPTPLRRAFVDLRVRIFLFLGPEVLVGIFCVLHYAA